MVFWDTLTISWFITVPEYHVCCSEVNPEWEV
jgi:hypothetical protein